MDLRNINQPSAEGKQKTVVKKSSANRPNTATVVAQRYKKGSTGGLPDGSKSLPKIHPLGTIPKYLRKQKQTSSSTSHPSLLETIVTRSDRQADPTEPFKAASDEQLIIEYKQQTIDRLERHVQELLSEIGYRERRIKELEISLSGTRNTLAQMQSMMQSHLNAQQRIIKRIPEENKTQLLLQMILDSQTSSRQVQAREQDHEDRFS
ncbi:uncharacterized protein LOC126559115 [Anopheles maculipalpis]|uniref:uncharacterized protein LOC126559115 n=1 Tax=Anopheles maculipalpis TaxID=1496333 RepID=UPI002158C909|nr:uncharacterized protein LOC126559115 [Anopheles maculipalpis]